jgi:Icc-related predicted phosphoesterase
VRISVVADVHGNIADLARAGDDADLLLVLGDLLDYVDYHDPTGGILGRVFGAAAVEPFIRLRTRGDFAGLHAYNVKLWAEIGDPADTISGIVRDRYAEIVDILPPHTLVMLGNVDVLEDWRSVAPPHLQPLDGQTREIGGRRFGFVGGGSTRPGVALRRGGSPWQPYVRSADDYLSSVEALGPVDVLCTHIPPNLPLLRYDRIPARLEMYGPGLLEYIDTHQPELALSGHVHQPIAGRQRRGHTECVNVGHFQRVGQPYRIEL